MASFQQTDGSLVFWSSPGNGSAYSNVVAEINGTAGSATVTQSLGGSQSDSPIPISFCKCPAGLIGKGGTWTMRLNVTTANMNLTITGFLIERYRAAGDDAGQDGNPTDPFNGSPTNLYESSGLSDTSLQTTGVKTWTLSSLADCDLNANDWIRVVIKITNSSMSLQSFQYLHNQLIGTPIIVPNLTLSHWRGRGDGAENGGTWLANLDTTWDQQAGSVFRVRTELQDVLPTSWLSAFKAEYRHESGTYEVLAEQRKQGGMQGYGLATGYTKLAQSFQFSSAKTVRSVYLRLEKNGTPTDNLVVTIRASRDGTVLATASIAGGSLTTSAVLYHLVFDAPVSIPASTEYWLQFTRSGSLSDTDNFRIARSSNSQYANGSLWAFHVTPQTWSDQSTDAFFVLIQGELFDDWTSMPAQSTGSVPVRFKASSNLTDGGATTQQLGGGGTFAAGKIYETAHTNTISFGTSDTLTEIEAVLELVASEFAEDDRIKVRIRPTLGQLYATTNQPLITGTVSAAVNIDPSFISSTAQVFGPTVIAAVKIDPSFISSTATVFAPALGIGIAPSFVNSTATVYEPAIQSPVYIDPSFISSTAFVQTPAIGFGVEPSFVPSIAQVFAPIVVAAEAIEPSLISSAAQVFAATVGSGITPSFIGSAEQVFVPEFQSPLYIDPGFINSTATVHGPSIGIGIEPSFIASAGQVFAPTVIAAQSVEPGFISSSTQVFAPEVSSMGLVEPGFISSTAVVFAPGVGYGIEVVFVSPSSLVYTPLGVNSLAPWKPSVTSAIIVGSTLTLQSSIFGSYDPLANHAASDWLVRVEGGGSTMFSSGRDTVHLTSIDIDVSGWSNGNYEALVRHQDDRP